MAESKVKHRVTSEKMLSKNDSENQMFEAHECNKCGVMQMICPFRLVGLMWECLLRKCPVLCLVVAPQTAAFNNYHSVGHQQPFSICSLSDIDIFLHICTHLN